TAVEPAPPSALADDVEAPAVPLNRTDEEFVTTRLTQAEILEKYGLRDRALEQLEEATRRFPGHLEAQQRRVDFFGGSAEDAAKLGPALLGLALARRASGDMAGAREAVSRALRSMSLDEATQQLLERLRLLDTPQAPAATPPSPPLAAAPEAPPTSAPLAADDDLVIDFDAEESDALAAAPAEPPPPQAPPRAARPPVREPKPDMLDEIRQLLESGDPDHARRRVDALRALGYGSAALDALDARIAQAEAALALDQELERQQPVAAPFPPPPEPQPEEPIPLAAAPRLVEDEDDDLSAITAALESELFDAGNAPLVPEASKEQSIEEVFAAFRQQVAVEVAKDDYRTHYDLGIAYKEMGLVDEAIAEFEISAQTPTLFREACTMIALCHRERSDYDAATRWYRQALSQPGTDAEALCALHYDLADMLFQAGDPAGALSELRGVLDLDPSYRDVSHRIAEIESSRD
ncbi:MAG TPA: tetratricopeptide repeat protein, partial [Candidatus Polarisedimenticolaceae bacterium]|nr:tetratricopeptide repeat protein [Candidatus Polarisedimenticolaceae bacterium]